MATQNAEEPLLKDSATKKKENAFLSFIKGMKDWRISTWIKLFIIFSVIIAVVILFVFFKSKVTNGFFEALNWIKKLGWYGGAVFVGLYIVCTVAFIPGSILTLGGGFIFGKYWGTFVVWLGATIGAILAFILGSTLLRKWVEGKAQEHPKFRAIDSAIEAQGWKIVLLLRLSPVIPFNLLNYALALTKVKLLHYSLSTAFGMLPGTIMYVYFGSLARNLADVANGKAGPNLKIQIVIWVVSGVVIVATVVFITIIAKRAINKAFKEQEEKMGINNTGTV